MTNIRNLIKEIEFASHKECQEVQEKIEIVQEEGLKLIAQSNKIRDAKKSAKLFATGDSIIERLTKAVCK